MKKFVLAFDSFKGCISAQEACHSAAEAIQRIWPEAVVVECPLSDGGEGLVDCIEQRIPTRRIHLKAHDPLMNLIEVSYLLSIDSQTAYMEMAATSGLTLVPPELRNPMRTTTYGVGEMIADAVRRGCKHIVMGIGGSATCDGGQGMIKAMIRNLGILELRNLVRITVACDVSNPLYGEKGAAYVFAPQKGATPELVEMLDEQLRSFARETEQLGLATPELANYPGAGAAGGLGYGLMAYLNAELKSGIDILLDIAGFDALIDDADVVITGEGKSDHQTLMGKVPDGVLHRVRGLQSHNDSLRPQVWLLSGCIDDAEGNLARSFDVVRSINEGDERPLETLLLPETAKMNLQKCLERLK